jgi:hypothetical protein
MKKSINSPIQAINAQSVWINPYRLISQDRLSKPLTPARLRDWEMIQPFMGTGLWFTSISLAKNLYKDGNYTRTEISKLSSILSKLYHSTNLLIRKPKRNIYFHNIKKGNISTWAYKLNPNLIKEHEK